MAVDVFLVQVIADQHIRDTENRARKNLTVMDGRTQQPIPEVPATVAAVPPVASPRRPELSDMEQAALNKAASDSRARRSLELETKERERKLNLAQELADRIKIQDKKDFEKLCFGATAARPLGEDLNRPLTDKEADELRKKVKRMQEQQRVHEEEEDRKKQTIPRESAATPDSTEGPEPRPSLVQLTGRTADRCFPAPPAVNPVITTARIRVNAPSPIISSTERMPVIISMIPRSDIQQCLRQHRPI
jgi:hypothetical protein